MDDEVPKSSWNVSGWWFPKIGVLQNGWFIMENPIRLDDFGGTGYPYFSEKSISASQRIQAAVSLYVYKK